jgi:GAF domain-containing protein
MALMIPEEKKWTEDEVNILQTLARNVASSLNVSQEKQQFMKVKKIPFVSQ